MRGENNATDGDANGRVGQVATLHFAIKLANGEVVDSNFGAEPVSFVFGEGSLPEHFQALIARMQPGEHRSFRLLAHEGFGEYLPERVQRFAHARFQSLPERGEVIWFDQAGSAGGMSGVVADVDITHVTVDFNHPLAGRELLFEAELLQLEAVGADIGAAANTPPE